MTAGTFVCCTGVVFAHLDLSLQLVAFSLREPLDCLGIIRVGSYRALFFGKDEMSLKAPSPVFEKMCQSLLHERKAVVLGHRRYAYVLKHVQ